MQEARAHTPTPAQPRTTENVRTSPHLFPCLCELYGRKKKGVPQSCSFGDVSLQSTGTTSAYLTKLKGAREEVLQCLQSLELTEPQQLDEKLDAYITLAAPLLPQLASNCPASTSQRDKQHAAPGGNEMDVTESLEPAPRHGGSGSNVAFMRASSVAMLPPDAYQGVGTFTWRNQLLSFPESNMTSCGGLAMDVGYILLHGSLWRWSKAVQILLQMGGVVDSDPVLQAYRLLRQAAGGLAALRTQLLPSCVSTLSMIPSLEHIQPTSGDLNGHLLEALHAACLADAQSLSLLRACNKEGAYQSASLISSIAHDTGGLYATALLRVSTFASARPTPGTNLTNTFPTPANGGAVTSNSSSDVSEQSIDTLAGIPKELGAYCRYKFAACRAYALIFAALTAQRDEQKAGWAVRVAQEALVWEEKATKRLGSEFTRAAKRKDRERAAFDADLTSQVQRAFARLQRDNDFVYYKRVPPAMPQDVLPQGRRVVEAAPLELPTQPASPFTSEDAVRVLEDSIVAVAKHKADTDPPASGAHASGNNEIEERDPSTKPRVAAAQEPQQPPQQQKQQKGSKPECCHVQ